MSKLRIWLSAATAVGACAAAIAACSTSNPGYHPYGSGSSTGAGNGSGASSGGASGSSSGSPGTSGSSSGSSGSSGSGGSGTSSSGSSACPATYYKQADGGCSCAGNALPEVTEADGNVILQPGAPCVCEFGYNAVCPDMTGAYQCANTTTEVLNCGSCGTKCAAGAACIPSADGGTGACGPAPTTLVPAAAGCMPIIDAGGAIGPNNSPLTLAYYMSKIYWSDALNGTIKSIAASGGNAATLSQNESAPGGLIVYSGTGASKGTLYWIDTGDNTIRSLAPGGAVKTLVAMAPKVPPWDAGADAAANVLLTGADDDAGVGIIHGLATSPDGATVYFSAGADIYKVASGGGAYSFVGYAEGPAHGIPQALAADSQYVYYGTNQSGNIEIMSLTQVCDLAAANAEQCPTRVAESQQFLPSYIAVRGDTLYWAAGTIINAVSVVGAVDAGISGPHSVTPSAANGTAITGFALGPTNAYFAEDGSIERSALPAQGSSQTVVIIANNQPLPSSLQLDGTNVYWTTSRCDIMKLPDSPQ